MTVSIPVELAKFPALAEFYEKAVSRAEGGYTFGEIIATINDAAAIAVKTASKFENLTGPEKKALVDKAIFAIYYAVRPSLSLAWWLPVWVVDPFIIAAIPIITESVYRAFIKFTAEG